MTDQVPRHASISMLKAMRFQFHHPRCILLYSGQYTDGFNADAVGKTVPFKHHSYYDFMLVLDSIWTCKMK